MEKFRLLQENGADEKQIFLFLYVFAFYNFGKAVTVSGGEPSDKKRAGDPEEISGHPLSTRINSYCNPV